MQGQLKRLSKGKTLALALLVSFSLLVRIIPIIGNNFFFTIDQGRDAVYVRDIVERKQIIKKGPETSIPGIYVGPGWFYFLSVGHILTNGHPIGGVLLMILLSLAASLVLFWYTNKYFSFTKALILSFSLQIFWPFYDTSRWSFNPFPTVLLAILLVILLVRFLLEDKKFYFLALIPVVFSFNSDLASAAVLWSLYVSVGLFGLVNKKITLKNYLLAAFGIPSFLSLFVIRQAFKVFKNPGQLENTVGVFSGTSFQSMFTNFSQIISSAVIPGSAILSLVVIIAIVVFYLRKSTARNRFSTYYFSLTSVLFIISYLFFSTNKGWRDWHTVFLPVLIFTSLFFMAMQLKKSYAIPLIGIILISQALVFIPRYAEYLKPSTDPSILANQIKVIDWIYSKSEENGFNAYTYMTNSYFDYPYQYLFWWHGKGKYGHVPCHYEVYPKSHKYIYVPGGEFNYNTPTLGCDKLVFLIKEPVKDWDRYGKWQENFLNTKLIETIEIGKITVEKREYIK